MRRALTWFAVLALASGASAVIHAQEVKKGGRASATASASALYRTLTGKVSDLNAGEMMVTLEVASDGTAARTKAKGASGQSWLLSVGRQTLLLRAGKNNQFATIEFGELQKGDSVQAVASLQADPSDRSHTAWWLVVYPAGMTPPSR